MRILCVDDNADSIEVVSLTLKLANDNFEIETAKDAEEAMALALSKPFDVYLLDMCLPKMDGPELCRWIRDNDANSQVVFFSAAAGDGDRELGLKAGAREYLVKPNDFDRLPTVIESLLSTPQRASGSN
jgi:DNA-binding response OmpR family regulator